MWISEEAPLIRTTTLSLTRAIQRPVVILHTLTIDCVTGCCSELNLDLECVATEARREGVMAWKRAWDPENRVRDRLEMIAGKRWVVYVGGVGRN